jgi:lipopolysaccharide export system permease protein
MKIIYRYLIKNFLGPFVLTFFFAVFILLMQWLWKYVDDLVGKGLEIRYILELLFYASATMVPMAVPLAVLLSSLMTFGNLGERYEIVAMKSAGIPIKKLMLPLAMVALIIGCFSFAFSNWVVPKSYVKMKTLLVDIQEQKPALNIETGTFYTGFDDFTIRIGKKSGNNEEIEDVLIYDHSNNQGNTTMTYAKRGSMQMTPDKKYLLFRLYDGYYWDESRNSTNRKVGSRNSYYPLMRATFKEQYKRFDLSSFQMQKSDDSFFEGTNQAMPISELGAQIDTFKTAIKKLSLTVVESFLYNMYYFNAFVKPKEELSPADTVLYFYGINKDYAVPDQKRVLMFAQQSSQNCINSINFTYDDLKFRHHSLWAYQIEYQRKFTLAFACLLMFFVGAPLGSLIRKGGLAVPLVITVLFFTFYFVISIIGEKVAKGSVFPVIVGMWLSSLILLPVCAILTHQATEDFSSFSWERWMEWLREFIKKRPYILFKKRKKI